jgi:hypothetical protein
MSQFWAMCLRCSCAATGLFALLLVAGCGGEIIGSEQPVRGADPRRRMRKTDRDELLLNQAAQCVISLPSAKEWFAQLGDDHQRDVVRKLAVMIRQASSTTDDVKNAIPEAELRETSTAAVLLSSGQLSVQLAKIVGLPSRQRAEGFILMVATFRVADTRRRGNSLPRTMHPLVA